jgi:hypothetical protein
VILLPTLLLVAEAPAQQPPAITIDPCIEVDADEVRRLTAMELRTWRFRTPPETLEVQALCEADLEQLRLINRANSEVTVRSIDLSAPAGDAKARELALAIAELLRRADLAAAPEEPAVPPPPPPPPPPVVLPAPIVPSPEPWRLEMGAAAVVAGWSGGEVLLGADATGRVRAGSWLIAELRFGGRKTRTIELERGSMDALGVAGAAGLSFDLTPHFREAGVSLGGRLGADWLRYAMVDDEGSVVGGRDATLVSLAGVATGFVALSSALCLTGEAAVGGALHSVAVRENGELVSAASGLLLSGAVGLSAHF